MREVAHPDLNAGLFEESANDALLATRDGQAIYARVDAATCEFFSGRNLHVRQVALTVMRAKGLA